MRILGFDAGWAASRLSVMDAAPRAQARRGQRVSSHPAIQLMVLIEAATGIGRESFFELILERARRDDTASVDYVKERRVLLDWWYGTRSIPTWACEPVLEGALALLVTGRLAGDNLVAIGRRIEDVLAVLCGSELRMRFVLQVAATLQRAIPSTGDEYAVTPVAE